MPGSHLNAILPLIRKWIGASASDGESDGQLLSRFLAQRDQTAFAALVERHGAMVLSVCRRLLRDPHEAEDAFQATFLVLVRKAPSIVRQESVGSWLYGVAYRLALRARMQAERRQKQDSEVENVPAPETHPAGAWDELRPVLDEEVNRLPEKYRRPVVLCYFEGKPYEEAARLLGWPAGTVSGRLARARDILRQRLTRRGVVLASSFPAILLADQRVSAELLTATVRSACHYAAGPAAGAVPATVAALTDGMLRAMFVQKLKLAAVVLGVLLVLGVGVGVGLRVHAGKTPAEIVADPERPQVKDGVLPIGVRQGEVVDVEFASDGKRVVVARTGLLANYDPTTHEPIGIFGRIELKDWGSVVVYDAATHEERGEIMADCRAGTFRRIAASPDGLTAVVDCGLWRVGGVKLYNLATKQEIGGLEGTPPRVSGLAFAPDGKTIACAGSWPDDKDRSRTGRTAVQLWEVGTRKVRTTLEGACDTLAFSPDGKFLATGGKKGGVKLWNAETGAAVATLPSDESPLHRLAFSPDGKKLLVGTNQGIQLWDVADRKRDWTSPRSLDVSALAYSPDGKRVASGDYAGRARVWDAATGEEIDDCQVTTAYVTALAFAPDGQSLVVGSGHYFNERGRKLTFDGYPARVWKLKK